LIDGKGWSLVAEPVVVAVASVEVAVVVAYQKDLVAAA
jgi:hypothetical protein